MEPNRYGEYNVRICVRSNFMVHYFHAPLYFLNTFHREMVETLFDF